MRVLSVPLSYMIVNWISSGFGLYKKRHLRHHHLIQLVDYLRTKICRLNDSENNNN